MSFVLHVDRNILLGFAAAANVNTLPWVFMISVNGGVREGLTQRNFNVHLVSASALTLVDQEHEPVNKSGDSSDFTRQGQLYLDARPVVLPIALPLSSHHRCESKMHAKLLLP
jgi:hypothetical protein